MKFVTSDTHFGHNKEFIYKARGYSSIEMHDQINLNLWNRTVKPEDEVYHLGDISWFSPKGTKHILDSLNGKKYLIRGNHDKPKNDKHYESCFEWIKDYYELKVDNQHIIMCHYPFYTWNGSHHGSISLHGHIHDKTLEIYHPNRLNIGVDIFGGPISIDNILELIRNRNENKLKKQHTKRDSFNSKTNRRTWWKALSSWWRND